MYDFALCQTCINLFAISRQRIGVDGFGITTWGALIGCPLWCKYCNSFYRTIKFLFSISRLRSNNIPKRS